MCSLGRRGVAREEAASWSLLRVSFVWIRILASALASCAILGKLLNLSEPPFSYQSFLLLPRQTADQGHAHRPGSFLQLPLFLRKAFLNFLMPARNSDNKKRSLTLTREFGTFQHLFSFTLELGWVWPGLARGLTAAPGAGLNAFTRHILKPPPQPGLGSFWVRASHQPSAAPSSPKDAPSSLAPCHLSGAHHLLSHLDN